MGQEVGIKAMHVDLSKPCTWTYQSHARVPVISYRSGAKGSGEVLFSKPCYCQTCAYQRHARVPVISVHPSGIKTGGRFQSRI